MNETEYISIPQLAKILNISRIAVYKKVKKGEIEAKKIGRNYAVSKDYILANIGRFIKRTQKSKSEKINQAVDLAFEQYKETFRRLGNE